MPRTTSSPAGGPDAGAANPASPPAPAATGGRSPSVTDHIVGALAQAIVRGGIAPGTRLRQDAIAHEFGASHVPVREAFRRLEAQGLVRSEPRRGVYVPPLDPRGVEELVLMREVLETAALREAMRRAPGAGVDAARRLLHEEAGTTDVFALEDLNQRFHAALLAPCGMPKLLASIRELHHGSARYLFACWTALDWSARSHREHRRLLSAVARGDEDGACEELRAHIRGAGAALTRALAAAKGQAG